MTETGKDRVADAFAQLKGDTSIAKCLGVVNEGEKKELYLSFVKVDTRNPTDQLLLQQVETTAGVHPFGIKANEPQTLCRAVFVLEPCVSDVHLAYRDAVARSKGAKGNVAFNVARLELKELFDPLLELLNRLKFYVLEASHGPDSQAFESCVLGEASSLWAVERDIGEFSRGVSHLGALDGPDKSLMDSIKTSGLPEVTVSGCYRLDESGQADGSAQLTLRMDHGFRRMVPVLDPQRKVQVREHLARVRQAADEVSSIDAQTLEKFKEAIQAQMESSDFENVNLGDPEVVQDTTVPTATSKADIVSAETRDRAKDYIELSKASASIDTMLTIHKGLASKRDALETGMKDWLSAAESLVPPSADKSTASAGPSTASAK